jgi:putative ABC transport system ATP-binding protein
VALARALINDPVLVLADEPTGNLDSRTGREVLDLLRARRRRARLDRRVVTHDVQAAMTADRIVFLHDGALSRASDGDRAGGHHLGG